MSTYRDRQKAKIDKSHQLCEEHLEIRAPAGTSRFYGVRECKVCGAEIIEHPAGLFIDDDLFYPCIE